MWTAFRHRLEFRPSACERLECGEVEPTGDEILILADHFRKDFRFLLADDARDPDEGVEILFRERGDDLSPADRIAIAEFAFLCRSEAMLEHELGVLQPKRTFAFHPRGSYFKGQGADCAAAVRVYLDLSDKEVARDVFATIRDLGIKLFRRRLENSNISGLFMNHPEAGPCILVNLAEGIARQRFSAMHELGHGLLDEKPATLSMVGEWSSADLLEVRANTFASHFLMPPALLSGVSKERWADPAEVSSWAGRLRVSLPALLSALHAAKLIDGDQWRSLRQSAARPLEPPDPELEVGGLNPAQAARKAALLERGLSKVYVDRCSMLIIVKLSRWDCLPRCCWPLRGKPPRSRLCLGDRLGMIERAGITVDVRAFASISAIDTCSIWNLLSSPCLLGAALRKGRWFVVAGYVRYEALAKPRTRPTAQELAMQGEFCRRLTNRQGFAEEPMTLDDLQAVAAVPEARRLGRGEIAALALARNLRSAVLTEDQAARKAASRVGVGRAQTTPHLLGWLLYEGELTDGDVSTVIREHEARIAERRGRLTVYLQRIYVEACRCRLLRDGAVEERAQAG